MEKRPYTRYTNVFRLKNKHQILSLKISEEDRYLIKEETLISIVWRGDHESSVFYAYLANQHSGIMASDDLEKMNQALLDKINPKDSIQKIIAPLLGILENGWYQIFYHEPLPIAINPNPAEGAPTYFGSYNFSFNHASNSSEKQKSIWLDDTILFTQDMATLDLNRVAFYKKNILAGKRPTIVTLAVANFGTLNTIEEFNKMYPEPTRIDYTIDEALTCVNPQFIIDGHHKAKAYLETGERPSIISLVKLQFKKEHEEFTKKKNNFKP